MPGALELLVAVLLLGLLENELLKGQELSCPVYPLVRQQVFVDLVNGSLDAAPAARAGLGLDQLSQPIHSAVVDCLRDVEAEVEAGVVRPPQHRDDRVLGVLGLAYPELRVLLLEVVRVYQRSLVPEVLLARTEVLREESRRLLLQDLFVLVVDRIPKL